MFISMNPNSVHPHSGKPCNEIRTELYTFYDCFSVGTSDVRCTLDITIQKVFKVLNETGVIDTACTGCCMDIFPVKKRDKT